MPGSRLGLQRSSFLMLSLCRVTHRGGLARETSEGKQGGRWLCRPMSFSSPRAWWEDLNPGSQAGTKIEEDGAQPLLHQFLPASSKSVQSSQSPHQPCPGLYPWTLEGYVCGHQRLALASASPGFWALFHPLQATGPGPPLKYGFGPDLL